VEADRELILEDARSIQDAMWRIAQLAQDAAETLDARIEDEDLDGRAEAAEVREALEAGAGHQPGGERGGGRLPGQARSLGGPGGRSYGPRFFSGARPT
jgi:hypothetical protein